MGLFSGDNLLYWTIGLRAFLVIFGIFELYLWNRKSGNLTEKFSWKPTPLQEASSNFLMIGLFIVAFVFVITFNYWNSIANDEGSLFIRMLIPMDIVLLIFVIFLYSYPKKAIIAKEGFSYSGALVPWVAIKDYHVNSKLKKVVIERPKKNLLSNDIHIFLPSDIEGMMEALDEGLGKKKKKGKGRKRDDFLEPDDDEDDSWLDDDGEKQDTKKSTRGGKSKRPSRKTSSPEARRGGTAPSPRDGDRSPSKPKDRSGKKGLSKKSGKKKK